MGFTIENGVLTKYTPVPGLTEITIPAKVREIGKNAFAQCYDLTGIVIPQSVKKIGEGAFNSCYALRSILLPKGITEIETAAFAWCEGLKEVYIPEHVRTIGYRAFIGCKNLDAVQLPKRLLDIKDSAFEDCHSLRRITVPKGVLHIGMKACCATEEIQVEKGNKHFTALDGVLYDREFRTLMQCPASREELVIPETVTTIMRHAFYRCQELKEVTLPEKLKLIQFQAFSYCLALEEINIPAQVLQIQDNPFMACGRLAEIRVAPENPHFTVKDGVLYSKNGTHIVHFPLDRERVVLRDTVTEFPMVLSSGMCREVEYKGEVFRCRQREMRFLLNALVNGNYQYFASDLSGEVQYDILCKLRKIAPECREEIAEKMRGKLGKLFRWLIDQNMQAQAEELLVQGGFDLREEIGELILYANEKGRYEFQLMLVNYMHAHGGYDADDFSL